MSTTTTTDYGPPYYGLTPGQSRVLQALINTFLPPLPTPDDDDDDDDDAKDSFYATDVSRHPDLLRALATIVLDRLHPDESVRLRAVLSALSTSVGSRLVTGVCPRARGAFPSWSSEDRARAASSLRDSALSTRRAIFVGLKRLVCGTAVSFAAEDDDANPFWRGVGYPGPCQRTLGEEEDARRLRQTNETTTLLRKALMTEDELESSTSLEFDVVVVGSGAGGGAAAAAFAEAGFSTLVVEKGPYLPPESISNLECEAMDVMYENHSFLTTRDGNMLILAGSTLGGGTAVNWGCCLDTPTAVREEWVEHHGLTDFAAHGPFDDSLRAVKKRVGASLPTPADDHNRANRVLIAGCERIKAKCRPAANNFRSAEPSAGHTCFGDRYGNKQGTRDTFLVDAARAGCRLVDDCEVSLVTTEIDPVTGRRRATGVTATRGDAAFRFGARGCVVSSAGSLHTPGLLRRSGLVNPHVGRHLRLHPVAVVAGRFPNVVRQWSGPPMTVVCEEFVSDDPYGARVEVPAAHPGVTAALQPWADATRYRKSLRGLERRAALLALQRDRGEGRVTHKPRVAAADGETTTTTSWTPVVDYDLDPRDAESLTRAAEGALRILVAAGADEVSVMDDDDPGHAVAGSDDDGKRALESYLEGVRRRGVARYRTVLASAHQMGSCRAGVSPRTSATDPNGETWECDDLYVMDASLFPTASGANPMLTTLAFARMLAERAARDRRTRGSRESRARGWTTTTTTTTTTTKVVENGLVFGFVFVCVSFLVRWWTLN